MALKDLKNVDQPKRDKDYVLRERLGVGPREKAAIERGVEAGKDSVGRVVKGGIYAKHGQSSIIGMAKDNVFEFPVFVSNNVPLEAATAVNSLLEQVYASYLQMAMSINPVISSDDLKSGAHFSKFKTNITKYIECVDLSYQMDAAHAEYQLEDGSVLEFHMADIDDKDAQFINEYLNYQPLSEFDHYFQEADNPGHDDGLTAAERAEKAVAEAGQAIRKNNAATRAIEKRNELLQANRDLNAAIVRLDEAKEARRNAKGRAAKDAADERLDRATRDAIAAKDRFEELKANVRDRLKADGTTETPEFRELVAKLEKAEKEVQKLNLDIAKGEKDLANMDAKEIREAEKHNADMKVKAPQQIDETKLNKLNTMKPLMMVVNLSIMDKQGSVSRPIEYMVGVKTHCRLIEASTLPEVVKYPVQEMDKISRKAKWRAGELKFFKDIVFDISGKKQTAIDSQNPNRKWYRRLYQLSKMEGDSVTARHITGKSGAGSSPKGLIPNVTMVITQHDVDMIEEATKIDLMKPGNARDLCKQLFMMGLVVIDEDANAIKMLFPDINNDYEVQSTAAVEKQISQLGTAGEKTRDLFKMLQR